ncbi:MAG: Spy/CpxP family protein refolding chaperone [Vicinamibacterales bacterium]
MALVVATTCLPAAAQGFKWWQDAKFQAEMELTPDQVSRIDKVFEDARPTLRAQKRALDKLEDELSRMVAEARAGEAELAAFVERVEDARADLSKNRTLMLYRMRRILSAEQHVKLKALFEAREKQRHSQRPPRE